MKKVRFLIFVLTATLYVTLSQATASAQTAKKPDAELETMRQAMIDRAVAFLWTQQQENGSFTTNPRSGIGQTAIATVGLLKAGVSPDDPMVKKAIAYLMTFAKENGAFDSAGEQLANYETCVVMFALSLANTGGIYDEILKRSDAFLRGIQFTEANGITRDDPNYGGAGYGGRADVSNTDFLIEALRITSKGADDPAIQKALVFISRCQNLESEHNNSPKVPKNPDGGFYYAAQNGGESYAGETEDGGLRSYGSMTYAGFKSLIYAGLTASDPRYQAAEAWLKKNYDIESNPGIGQSGLFYYYHTMAKTLAVTGWKTFTTADGIEHDWRAELIEMLALRQRADGSWVNIDPRWLENDPGLVTGYVLVVLSECQKRPAANREYYQSQIGLWYTVWWDSLERDPVFFKHHWGTNTRVKPIKHGYYATDDPEKLKDDFQFFHRIGIDYLILDDTNGHYNDAGNIAAHIDACFVMAKELGNNAPKLCFAGGRPLIDGNVDGMQAELDIFAGYAERYPDNTYFWKGKPLFVNFNIAKNYSYQDKLDRFTMRPATGHLLEGFHAYKEHNLDKTGMYGWVFDMQYETSEVYGITPGFSRSHNNLGTTLEPIERENGERYRREWLNAIKRKPEMIVISSWNDHAEETSIEAVELLEPIPGRGEEDPFFYEKITEGYLALKTGYLENWYYRSESDTQVYQYRTGKLSRVSHLNDKEVVIVVPDDYFDWAGVPRD